MADKKNYESTVMRMAGNIAGAMLTDQAWGPGRVDLVAHDSVSLARAIVAEVQRTEPKDEK